MNGIRIPLTFFLFAAATLVAEAQPTIHPVLVPLGIGNRWSYQTCIPCHGKRIDTVRSTTWIVGTAWRNGDLWYEFETAMAGDTAPPPSRDLWAATGVGLEMQAANSGYRIRFPYWTEPGRVMEIDPGMTITIVAVDSLIRVPAGSFRCHFFSVADALMGATTNMAIAPGVGIVYTDDNLGPLATRTELVSWEVR